MLFLIKYIFRYDFANDKSSISSQSVQLLLSYIPYRDFQAIVQKSNQESLKIKLLSKVDLSSGNDNEGKH